MTTLYLVIPCYNEEGVIFDTASRLLAKINALTDAGIISEASRILFIDDGSKDNTWEMINDLTQQDRHFAGAKLSRNQGHQNALLAGLTIAKDRCDAAISMDADLQDDINAIDEMLFHFKNDCDIVYGVRSSRENDTNFKRYTAKTFYKLMRSLGADIVSDHADYRLMSRRALEALMQYSESNMFLRGIVPLLGYKSAIVSYKRGERFAGESKYPLKRMLIFAFDGITSFSIRPIRIVTLLGSMIFAASLVALIVLLILKLLGHTVQGWATLMGSIWLLGGLQLLSIGIIGEYIGRVYHESKRRPRFFIEKLDIN